MSEELKPTEELKEEIEQPEEAPVEPTVAEEEVKEEKVEVAPTEDVVDPEDRSAYNCSSCNGEGLIWHDGAKRHERCSACAGTGKVN